MRRISTQTLIIIFVLVLAVIGTSVAIFAMPPEEIRAETDNGAVAVRGTVRGQADVQLIRTPLEGPYTAVTSPVYKLIHSGETLAQPLIIEIASDVDWLGAWPPGEIVGLIRDTSLNVWRPVDTEVDAPGRVIRLRVPARFVQNRELLFGMGRVEVPPVPERQSIVMDELRSFPPPRAVGYRLFSAYATEEQDFVLMDDALDYGGCEGVFRAGRTQTMSSQDLTMDDAVTYRIGAIWELKDGCVSDAEISSAK